MRTCQYPNASYLQSLAEQAGGVIKAYFSRALTPTWKPDETPLTLADSQINEIVRLHLKRDFPHITLIGEEGGYLIEDSEYRILEDSMDGTIAFTMGLPISSFCISVSRGHEPIEAVIYDPFQNRMWSATRGKGAFLNGQPVRVSDLTVLKRARASLIWWKGSGYNTYQVNDRVQEAGAKWVNLCSVALCGGLIAGGTMEASIYPGTKGWETAAMQLIVEEAGGKATDMFGKTLTYGPGGEIQGHIISNGHVHDELVRIVAECQ